MSEIELILGAIITVAFKLSILNGQEHSVVPNMYKWISH